LKFCRNEKSVAIRVGVYKSFVTTLHSVGCSPFCATILFAVILKASISREKLIHICVSNRLQIENDNTLSTLQKKWKTPVIVGSEPTEQTAFHSCAFRECKSCVSWNCLALTGLYFITRPLDQTQPARHPGFFCILLPTMHILETLCQPLNKPKLIRVSNNSLLPVLGRERKNSQAVSQFRQSGNGLASVNPEPNP
jgi:hypothetical protein